MHRRHLALKISFVLLMLSLLPTLVIPHSASDDPPQAEPPSVGQPVDPPHPATHTDAASSLMGSSAAEQVNTGKSSLPVSGSISSNPAFRGEDPRADARELLNTFRPADAPPVEEQYPDAPDYVRTAAQALAKQVASRQNDNTLTFLAVSDTHHTSTHDYYNQQMAETLTHLGQATAIVRTEVEVRGGRIDFAAMLGDIFWDSGETPSQAAAATRNVYEALYPAFDGIQNFWAVGNHDLLSSSDTGLTTDEIYANIGIYNDNVVVDSANPRGGYCYRDFPEYQLRVILLNTTESPIIAVDTAQLAWFAQALDLQEYGADWQSLLLSHVPLDYWGSDSAVMQVVKGARGIIANIHGHNHCYEVADLGGSGIPRICIPNACFWRSNERGCEPVTYDKTPGSAEDTAFCAVTIDFAARKIYADHYGAGYDRVVSYAQSTETYTITNCLTHVSSSNDAATTSQGGEYFATLTEADGYVMDSVTVTMGGIDVTASAYRGREIAILSATGDIMITATAVKKPAGLSLDGSGNDLILTLNEPIE